MSTVVRAAVDLGASSGRVLVGRLERDRIDLAEVARFPTAPRRRTTGPSGPGLFWDFDALLGHIRRGLDEAARQHSDLASVGIDSWAVDYGLLRQGELIDDPFCYRDERCQRGVDWVHQRVGFEQLHARNGLQFLPFTTVYQLGAESPPGRGADALLLVPDLVTHALTGHLATERTNASTTGLLDPRTGDWDTDLMAALGIPRALFTGLVDAGDERGHTRVGHRDLPVLTTASHDTAAAILATPMDPERSAYASLGTWGLVGVELEHPVLSEAARRANFTNEGGVAGTTRFLRNVMGTWLLSEVLREWGREDDLVDLLAAAAAQPAPRSLVDVDDPAFLAPDDMATRLTAWLREHDQPVPESAAGVVRLVVESTAAAQAAAVHRAGELTGRRVEQVHVVGGGSRSELLCQLLADHSGLTVLAGPVEATGIGNLLGQSGMTTRDDVERARSLVSASTRVRVHQPGGSVDDAQYRR
ncbi:rhamnulokinase [Aestuariimicrobium ganziense]|uniref:rhamnulokinase n=1 Tax=Aestuariimicrobium ganziense TaxID=2773677 RepID=UPI0019443978|nr:rhamnulokinase family protein [Aestuariimicrobium ganziense]